MRSLIGVSRLSSWFSHVDGNHGLALGGLDGVEQVEAVVIAALCYLQT
jgi:hypothetical protein